MANHHAKKRSPIAAITPITGKTMLLRVFITLGSVVVASAKFPFLNGIARFLPNRKLSEVTGRLNQLEA